MAISYEMKIADDDRLREIGRCLANDDTVSEDVKARLRGLYSRLMDHIQKQKKRRR